MAKKFIGNHKSKRPVTGGPKNTSLRESRIITKLASYSDPPRDKDVQYPLGYVDRNLPDDDNWTRESVVDLVVCCILQRGSKTPTHSSKLMEIYAMVLKRLESPGRVLYATMDFWRHSPIMCEMAVDRL